MEDDAQLYLNRRVEYELKRVGCENNLKSRYLKDVSKIINEPENQKCKNLKSGVVMYKIESWDKAFKTVIAFLKRYKMTNTLEAISSEFVYVPIKTGFKFASDLEAFFHKIINRKDTHRDIMRKIDRFSKEIGLDSNTNYNLRRFIPKVKTSTKDESRYNTVDSDSVFLISNMDYTDPKLERVLSQKIYGETLDTSGQIVKYVVEKSKRIQDEYIYDKKWTYSNRRSNTVDKIGSNKDYGNNAKRKLTKENYDSSYIANLIRDAPRRDISPPKNIRYVPITQKFVNKYEKCNSQYSTSSKGDDKYASKLASANDTYDYSYAYNTFDTGYYYYSSYYDSYNDSKVGSFEELQQLIDGTEEYKTYDSNDSLFRKTNLLKNDTKVVKSRPKKTYKDGTLVKDRSNNPLERYSRYNVTKKPNLTDIYRKKK